MSLFKKNQTAAEQPAAKKVNVTTQLVIPAICMFVSVAALAAATMAWFSMNRNVDSNGMQMDVEVSSNLIISAIESGSAGSGAINAADTGTISVPASAWTTLNAVHSGKFIPATHDAVNGGTVQLVYNTNPDQVHPSSGLAKDSTPLAFDAVEDSEDNGDVAADWYYRDYVVYIASGGKAFDASHLYVTFTGSAVSAQDYHDAASVDFWFSATGAGTPAYKGTLNLAGLDITNYNAAKTQIDLLNGTRTTVPLNTSDHFKVIMRFYYDGALKASSASTKTYINSAEVSSAMLNLTVSFAAEDYTA